MRECWVNVYPDLADPGARVPPFVGPECGTRNAADMSAIGPKAWLHERRHGNVGAAVRAAGVGYRLHVRLKPHVWQLQYGWSKN